jgi:tripartite-type tricarboxylate transporter receptor subunit TctC
MCSPSRIGALLQPFVRRASAPALLVAYSLLASSAAFDASAQTPAPTAASTYPTRPVRIVIPLGPGNSAEVVTRLVAQKLSIAFGQPFVIEPQPGAAGAIGTAHVARSAADGYTLLVATDGVMAALPVFKPDVPFNPLRDFVPVAQMAGIPFALIAHPSLRVSSAQQLVELAKAQPGKLDHATGGNGSAQQLAMAMFMTATGTQFSHVPYKGAPQAAMDVLAGRVPIAFAGVPIVAEFIRDGRLRALAVASDRRLPSLPQVPTLKEQGIAMQFATWVGLFAPAGTPREIVARLSEETVKALRAPEVAERLAALTFEIYGVPTEPFSEIVRADVARMAEVIKRSGMKAD